MQLAHATELEIIVTVPESRLSEDDGHKMFHHLRLSGEWFRPEPELLAFIETLKVPPLKLEPDPPPPDPEPPRTRPVFRAAPKKDDPLIGQLQNLRTAHGSETPIGHRCSNLTQMIPIYKASTDDNQRAFLAAGMARMMNELKKLSATDAQ